MSTENVQLDKVEFLTVDQVAKIFHIGRDTVRRYFFERPGVVKFGDPKEARTHRMFRIPRRVLDKFLEEHGYR